MINDTPNLSAPMADLGPFLRRRVDGRPRLMGIVNVTPDSFHAGSRVDSVTEAVAVGLSMWDAGADWVDVGGESTRPAARPVAVEEELERVVPVISALKDARPDGLISVDTRRPAVASAALDAGADMVNDVSGLRDPAMLELVRDRGCAVCIMHMLGEPGDMQTDPHYSDVVAEVSRELNAAAQSLIDQGHPPELICVDPGIGFGKLLEHNLALLRDGAQLRGPHDLALLWGASRKSMFKELLGQERAEDRLSGTLAVAAHAYNRGVDLLRVHDVAEHADLFTALKELQREA